MSIILVFLIGLIVGFLFSKLVGKPFIKYGGNIIVQGTETGGKLYTLELDTDPEELDSMEQVVFRISSRLQEV